MNALKRKAAYHDHDLIEIVRMRYQDFHEHVPGPTQRDTARHAAKLKPQLVEEGWKDVGLVVALYELPDGSRGMLNGHGRDYLWWNDEEVPKPPRPLIVFIYFCEDLASAGRLLRKFDEMGSAHTKNDHLFGAFRALNVTFKSERLKDKTIIGSLQIAQNFIDPAVRREDELARLWLPQLRLFDRVMARRTWKRKKRFTTAFLAAALVLLRRYGTEALPFLIAYENDRGNKGDGVIDAQEAFNVKASELINEQAKKFSPVRNEEILRVMVAGFKAVGAQQSFPAGVDVDWRKILSKREFENSWLRETRLQSGVDLQR